MDIRAGFAAWVGAVVCLGGAAAGGEHAQWGQRYSRNMVSGETGLVADFDPATGRNVRWTAPLGTQSYSAPTVAGGRVLVGTNNDNPRDRRHRGDRGVLLCLDAADGRMLWQLVVPKIPGDRYKDWPRAGLCSPPTVEGDRAYVVTNRGAVVCLDLAGQANGNDGPFRDEGRLMAPPDAPPMPVTDRDADVIWRFDTHAEAGTYPHDSAHASILLDGPYLYLNTSNGVDNTHRKIRRPGAPSLIVLDKRTGRLLARDAERIGPQTLHCTWSSPSLGTVNGRRLIFFGGGDGVLYGFAALDPADPPDGPEPARLETVWLFDCDPNAPKEDIHRYMGNRKESPSTIMGMPVFHGGRVYVAAGGDMWWGKRRCWLKCIDAGGAGDVTGERLVWSVELDRHCCATPSLADGLAYIADCGGVVRCLDAGTGVAKWSHRCRGPIWGSTMVADGKVYVGTRRGAFYIFRAGAEKELLASVKLDSGLSAPPTPADGVLYITTMRTLYAIGPAGK